MKWLIRILKKISESWHSDVEWYRREINEAIARKDYEWALFLTHELDGTNKIKLNGG